MTTPDTTELRDRLQGLWLPLVTPFRNGEIDEVSLRRLVQHYARQPIDGLILAATSGVNRSISWVVSNACSTNWSEKPLVTIGLFGP